MVTIHANGDEEQRPRTPEEVAEIEEANRIAAQSNIRSGRDRRKRQEDGPLFRRFCTEWTEVKTADGKKEIMKNVYVWHAEERSQNDRRAILSSFERDMLRGEL